jgi:hypothetical protein
MAGTGRKAANTDTKKEIVGILSDKDMVINSIGVGNKAALYFHPVANSSFYRSAEGQGSS